MQKFIGVNLVDAKPMTRGEYITLRGWELPKDEIGSDPGYLKDNGYGHVQWDPADVFMKENLPVVGEENKIHPEDVDAMIAGNFITTLNTPGSKSLTTAVVCTLINGFTITESSTCVDPANYSEEIGAEICIGKIKDKIWFLLGFLLQSGVYGFKADKK